MVLGWKNVELALKIENDEGIDRVAQTNLVDNWLEEPNLNSETNEVVNLNSLNAPDVDIILSPLKW